jgi:hypothetical protein
MRKALSLAQADSHCGANGFSGAGYVLGSVAAGIPSLTLVATVGLGAVAIGAAGARHLRCLAATVATGPRLPCDQG